jgi:hypothetical protein
VTLRREGDVMIECTPGTIQPPPSDATVEEFQGFWNVTLPAEYLEFLRLTNCGAPRKRCFGPHDLVVDRFLGLFDDPRAMGNIGAYDIDVTMSQIDDRLISEEERERDSDVAVVPIASMFGGDHVCLDFRHSAAPTVCIWSHEESKSGAPVFHWVANSFGEFLAMLRLPAEDAGDE